MALFCRTTFLNINGTSLTPSKRQYYPSYTIQMMASSNESSISTMESYEEGQLERPKWSGQTPLSRLVGALISFKPLYSVMKFGARQALISTAEKNNIPWREMTKDVLESSEVYKEMESVRNPHLVYPDYYLNPFHAYDEGNLSWLAAAEAEPATLSITLRAMPDASLDEAIDIVRGNWLRAIDQHLQQYSGNSTIEDILDIGCSIGWSTRFLANKFPSANVTGLDLSPYFLSVAQFKEKNEPSRAKPIKWVHANGEDTGLPPKSFDLISIAYVFHVLKESCMFRVGERLHIYLLHECPAKATVNLVKEAFKLLRPGGTFVITDNSPKSKKLQELSPVLFTLMKSTEPWLDEYYLLDLEATLREVGFVHVRTVLTDPRHRTITATVPV